MVCISEHRNFHIQGCHHNFWSWFWLCWFEKPDILCWWHPESPKYSCNSFLCLLESPAEGEHCWRWALLKVSPKTPKSLGPQAGVWRSYKCSYCLKKTGTGITGTFSQLPGCLWHILQNSLPLMHLFVGVQGKFTGIIGTGKKENTPLCFPIKFYPELGVYARVGFSLPFKFRLFQQSGWQDELRCWEGLLKFRRAGMSRCWRGGDGRHHRLLLPWE